MSLPEAMPTVTYDIAVGEQATWLDFDYTAFYDMATEAGLSHAQINKLDIEFKAQPGDTPLSNVLTASERPKRLLLGQYCNFFNLVFVHVSTIREFNAWESVAAAQDPTITPASVQELLNSTVVHETGHHIDFHQGPQKFYAALAFAGAVTLKSLQRAADKKPGRVLNKAASKLESGLQPIFAHDKESLRERSAYAFQERNESRYTIVTYEPSYKPEIVTVE